MKTGFQIMLFTSLLHSFQEKKEAYLRQVYFLLIVICAYSPFFVVCMQRLYIRPLLIHVPDDNLIPTAAQLFLIHWHFLVDLCLSPFSHLSQILKC